MHAFNPWNICLRYFTCVFIQRTPLTHAINKRPRLFLSIQVDIADKCPGLIRTTSRDGILPALTTLGKQNADHFVLGVSTLLEALLASSNPDLLGDEKITRKNLTLGARSSAKMVELLGFEPSSWESKSQVQPIYHSSMKCMFFRVARRRVGLTTHISGPCSVVDEQLLLSVWQLCTVSHRVLLRERQAICF